MVVIALRLYYYKFYSLQYFLAYRALQLQSLQALLLQLYRLYYYIYSLQLQLKLQLILQLYFFFQRNKLERNNWSFRTNYSFYGCQSLSSITIRLQLQIQQQSLQALLLQLYKLGSTIALQLYSYRYSSRAYSYR